MAKWDLGNTITGGKHTFTTNGEEVVISESQDVTGLLKRNAELKTLNQRNRGGYLLGSIDPVTYQNWEKEWKKGPCNTVTFPEYLVIKLKDRDNSKFRVTDKI